MNEDQVVLFVCTHGAGKSRMAAAYFNSTAPAGWRATTAGVEPQTQVSIHAPRLLAGTAARTHLDNEPPRPIAAVPSPARTIAIDCTVRDADRWDLDHTQFDETMRNEIAARVRALSQQIGG